jgi:4-hydroxy-tetrahydrodipicolinate synthase
MNIMNALLHAQPMNLNDLFCTFRKQNANLLIKFLRNIGMFNGYFAAVATPFDDGKLDINSFEKYISNLVGSGISGIVVCGSTGESLSLTEEEKIEIIKTASCINSGKIKLIAGVIDAVTDNCSKYMKKVDDIVDGFLCICPFYLKPSQDQIYNHFKYLSESTKRDIILYNNQTRVGSSIVLDTLKKLCDQNNIVAIKECAPDLSVFTIWRSVVKENFSFLSGNDDTACAAFAMGATGAISVSANIAPELCAKMHAAFKQNNLERFEILRDVLAPLHELMFAEPTPGPLKYALSKLKLIKEELRLPLSPISAELRTKIDTFIDNLKLEIAS